MTTLCFKKFGNPIFLISVFVLLLNDFFLKQTYGNVITGKLSDFAGLLAFPFFLSCLFPQKKKAVHILTGVLFVWWKSSYSQFFIDGINFIGFPIGRTIDFTDNIALVSILGSYYLLKSNMFIPFKSLYLNFIILLSGFSFIATSVPPRALVEYVSIDKEYEFNIPMEDFIVKFNALQLKEIKKRTGNNGTWGYFDEEKGVLFSHNHDTLIYIIDVRKDANPDTIRIRNYFSDFEIYSKDINITSLRLINIVSSLSFRNVKKIDSENIYIDESCFHHHYYIPQRPYCEIPAGSVTHNKFPKAAVKEFEKRIIKKIK